MKRKIIKLGTSTLVASLPSRWIKRNNLKGGDEIDVEEESNNLVISGKTEERKKKETTISLSSETESSVRTIITNAYRLGYDIIKIQFKKESQYRTLSKTIRSRLLGFDITKTEENYCIIENLTEPAIEQFDPLLQKMLYNISELLELTKRRLEDKKTQVNYEDIEEKIQQYDNFCKRAISKKKVPIEKPELFWLFLTLIVHGQREIYILNKYLDKKKIKEDSGMMDDCIKSFEMLKKAYLKKEIKFLEQQHEHEKEAIHDKAQKIFEKKQNTVVEHYVTSAIRQFYLAASPLMGLLID